MFSLALPVHSAPIFCKEEHILSFCSQDYFCLAEHPDIKKGAIQFLLEYGLASGGSTWTLQEHLLTKFSTLLEREAALFFPSYFEALYAVLTTFSTQGRRILADAACQIACHATYGHLNVTHLKELLNQEPEIPKLVVAESTFATTAAHADLSALIELARQFDALLLIDDSHSFGIRGFEGLGPCPLYKEIDLVIGSFDKACGIFGGYIACNCELRDTILDSSSISSFLQPPFLGALDVALEKLLLMDGERRQLQQRSHWMREQLAKKGWEIPYSQSPLLSFSFATEKEAKQLQETCKAAHILTRPFSIVPSEIKPYRLNMGITLGHTLEQLNQLLEVVQQGCLKVAQV